MSLKDLIKKLFKILLRLCKVVFSKIFFYSNWIRRSFKKNFNEDERNFQELEGGSYRYEKNEQIPKFYWKVVGNFLFLLILKVLFFPLKKKINKLKWKRVLCVFRLKDNEPASSRFEEEIFFFSIRTFAEKKKKKK